MSFRVAPYPSSSSKYAISHSETTASSPSQSSSSNSSAPRKEAWKKNDSSSSPKAVTTPKGTVTKPSKLDVLLIPGLLDKITQYAPNLALPLVHRTFKDTPMSISKVVHAVFIMRALPPRVPTENLVKGKSHLILVKDKSLITYESINTDLEKTAVPLKPDYASIWNKLPQYHQKMEEEYYRRVPLVQYSDYILQTIPCGIFLWFKELPPFSIHWSEEDFAKKTNKFNLYSSCKLPSDFQIGFRILRQMSYFLEEVSFSEVSSTPVVSFSKTANLIQLMLNASISGTEGLQHEIKKRIAEKPMFLSYLFRYIFDQLFVSHDSDSFYRADLYLMATSFVTHCDQHLSYEDLHYALLIHLYIVLTRIDIDKVSKDKILNPELTNLIFNKIKKKKADLDKTKEPELTGRTSQEPDLADLRQQLQIFLSLHRYKALKTKIAKAKRVPLIQLEMFGDLETYRHAAVLEIIEKYLPRFSKEVLVAKNNCCAIL